MNSYNTPRLAMFSGKGGVGKTTLSCGFARNWAQQFPHETILLLSTDPAHSLGDVMQLTVTDTAIAVPGLPNLWTRALNAETLLQSFRNHYGNVLELLVERGSFVQGEDLSPVWDLSWPGLDELMSILEIQRLLRQPEIDRIVVDMAPSGHTLNLFGLMDFLDTLLDSLELFQEKHRVISQSFTGQYTADTADRFLREMKDDLTGGRKLLQDPVQSACWVVAIPEPMSYLETQRLLQSLEKLHIPCGGLFINHLEATDPAQFPEQICAEQQELLEKFFVLADTRPLFAVPQQAQEPVGSAALDRLYRQVCHIQQPAPAPIAPTVAASALPEKLLPSLSDFVAEGRRLILVGGKGGVGKTTVSAAIAWAMAEHHPDRQIRVISIDPAHSLGDALGTTLAHEPTDLTVNLSAQEVDAHQVLNQFREDYLWELAEMMSGDSDDGSLQIAFGPQGWRQIVAQALPGIDEMLSLVTVIDLLDQGQQDLIVLDTAPTGHLLRFLEMPTALSDWLGWIFKLWMKYQDVVGRVEFMGRLRTLRQRVVQTQKRLKDPNHTEFIGVIQAQSAILAEAERLTQTLLERGVNQRYVVHNRFAEGQDPVNAHFPQQTCIRLPQLPRSLPPQAQIQAAAHLLF